MTSEKKQPTRSFMSFPPPRTEAPGAGVYPFPATHNFDRSPSQVDQLREGSRVRRSRSNQPDSISAAAPQGEHSEGPKVGENQHPSSPFPSGDKRTALRKLVDAILSCLKSLPIIGRLFQKPGRKKTKGTDVTGQQEVQGNRNAQTLKAALARSEGESGDKYQRRIAETKSGLIHQFRECCSQDQIDLLTELFRTFSPIIGGDEDGTIEASGSQAEGDDYYLEQDLSDVAVDFYQAASREVREEIRRIWLEMTGDPIVNALKHDFNEVKQVLERLRSGTAADRAELIRKALVEDQDIEKAMGVVGLCSREEQVIFLQKLIRYQVAEGASHESDVNGQIQERLFNYLREPRLPQLQTALAHFKRSVNGFEKEAEALKGAELGASRVPVWGDDDQLPRESRPPNRRQDSVRRRSIDDHEPSASDSQRRAHPRRDQEKQVPAAPASRRRTP